IITSESSCARSAHVARALVRGASALVSMPGSVEKVSTRHAQVRAPQHWKSLTAPYLLHLLENSCRALAAADAHRHHSVLDTPPRHFMKKSRCELGAAASQRMPQRDRAS